MRCTLALMLVAGLSVPAVAAQWTQGAGQQGAPPQQPPSQDVPAGRRGRDFRPPTDAPGGLRADEVQQIVDGWEIATAEKTLELNDQQYVPFIQQLRKLQSGRRQQFMQRQRMLMSLRQTLNQQPAADDAAIDARLKQYDDLERRHQQELQALHASIDAVLTPRQRARFRVLQEQMERRKLEVLSKAMRAGGPGK
jgi:Spy/CpxP family protein refolding chaperone